MAIGRYLSTDTADRIGQFGNAVGDMAGDVLDYQTLVARRADDERRRRVEESREKRLRENADLDEQRRMVEMGSELADMSPERRSLVAGTLAPKWRERFGFADAVPPMSLDVQPPTAVPPGSGLTPSTIETHGAPEFDPFAGLPQDESIEYRGSTFPTRDEYLGFRTDEERAIYEGRPDRRAGGSPFRPTGSDINNVLDPLTTEMGEFGIEVPTIPAEDRSRLYGGTRSGSIDIEALPDSVAAIKGRAPADVAETGGEDSRPGLLGRVGRFLGDRLGEVERVRRGEPAPEQSPTVRMPWPRPEEFRERAPEGMRGPDTGGADSAISASRRRLSGPEGAEAPTADMPGPSEMNDMIRQAASLGWSTDDIAAEIAGILEVDESEARQMVASVVGE
jgi:hypothetical protein